MKKVILFVITAFLFSCGSARLLVPVQTDAEVMKSKFPAITLEELNKGKADFEAQCGNCHGYKNPLKKSEEQWKTTVPKMAAKAKKKAGREVIDEATQQSILKYLITMRTTRAK